MAEREIIFDTETTGFDPFSGDRVIEIGCVEMVGKMLTGENFHVYTNPDREVPESAFKIHGISTAMLQDKPRFSEVAQDFLDFVGDSSKLVAHNADFDMKFINWELENAGLEKLPITRFHDTLAMARQKFPGASNSLDGLCKRFGVESSHRTLHGALLDSEILAEVYIELTGGRQAGLELVSENHFVAPSGAKAKRERRSFPASEAEIEAHKEFVKKLDNPLWLVDK